jgi:hypothetical protein
MLRFMLRVVQHAQLCLPVAGLDLVAWLLAASQGHTYGTPSTFPDTCILSCCNTGSQCGVSLPGRAGTQAAQAWHDGRRDKPFNSYVHIL